MLEKMKRSRSAVSTMVLAAIVVLILAVAAVGAYVLLSSDEDNGNDGNDGNNGNNGNNDVGDLPGLDFSDPMIQGTLGVGTAYTYDYTVDGVADGEVKITIIGQSGSYYAVEIEGNRFYEDYGMIHKQTGQLRFSESQGTEGTYGGESLTKWKLNMGDITIIDKTGDKEVTEKINSEMVFLSNSKSILPSEFYIYHNEELDGQKTHSDIGKGILSDKDMVAPAEYEMSKYIGNMAWYYVTTKENNKEVRYGDIYYRAVADLVSDKFLVFEIIQAEGNSDRSSINQRLLIYSVSSDVSYFYSSLSNYSQEGDENIDTNWGKKDCKYYYNEYDGYSYSSKNEVYVGKSDNIQYIIKETYIYPDYTEYTEGALKEYVFN